LLMAQTPGTLFFAHMRDGPMIRTRLPGGFVKSSQLRTIAELANDYGNGSIDLTNRANLQIRGLRRVRYKVLKAILKEADLLPQNQALDRLRNILADPLDGLDNSVIANSRPVVNALDIALQETPELQYLNPKFQFVVDNGGRSGVSGIDHDVGLVADYLAGCPGYRLSLGGFPTPLVTSPENATELAIVAARVALILAGLPENKLFRSIWIFKDRETRTRRLLGNISPEHMAGIIAGQMQDVAIVPLREGSQRRSLCPSIGVIGSSNMVGIGVPAGRLTGDMLALLADMAEKHGNGNLRLSPWHVVFLEDIGKEQAEAILTRLTRFGFVAGEQFARIRVAACSGRTGCRGARLDTRGDAIRIIRALEASEPDNSRPVSVHISGCAKGCAHRGRSDILALEGNGGYRIYKNSSPSLQSAGEQVAGNMNPEKMPEFISGMLTKKVGCVGEKIV
jgi:precorrin-3B synthase